MYKNTKWARELLSKQLNNGSWGQFHTLSGPRGGNVTTEIALRRLAVLGYTIDDEPIQRAVEYMSSCLSGVDQIPDRREKVVNWDIFSELMLSTWIRFFTPSNEQANRCAGKWGEIIRQSFLHGDYDSESTIRAYTEIFGEKPKGGRLIDFAAYYQVSLVGGLLYGDTERMFVQYLLHCSNGIYYIYGGCIAEDIHSIDFYSKKQANILRQLSC